jgi:predicted 2-oxoglutarate/Fe(II)-dependent dioxygenase YbiX
MQQHMDAAADAMAPVFAPILTIPRVFEPEFCAGLIRLFAATEATESAFAHEVDGRTVERVDPRLKRRRDVFIADESLVASIRHRLETRLFPMVTRAFGWQPIHIERYLISAYDARDRGFFSAHRDDVTAGTAHRKFAVTINLNAEAYEGGELHFPEFGKRTYRSPTGGATVFGCNLLHEATPVTKGVRYAFIPFLYDEAGDRLRKANLSLVGAKTG